MLPIYIIGAGGIVNDAHLPAYRLAGFEVAGIYDKNPDKARETADKFNIPQSYESLEAMLGDAPSGAIFDLALPASSIIPVLEQLPDGATVLLQKPMGNNYEETLR